MKFSYIRAKNDNQNMNPANSHITVEHIFSLLQSQKGIIVINLLKDVHRDVLKN